MLLTSDLDLWYDILVTRCGASFVSFFKGNDIRVSFYFILVEACIFLGLKRMIIPIDFLVVFLGE